jgi:hypothetical protein
MCTAVRDQRDAPAEEGSRSCCFLDAKRDSAPRVAVGRGHGVLENPHAERLITRDSN